MKGLKVVKVLIACCMAAALGGGEVQAQYDFCAAAPSGQMLYYRMVPERAQVMVTHPEREWPYYAGNKPVGDLVIPDHVRHEGVDYEVVGVGENAFYRCDSLTGLTAKGIATIGTQALCGCTALRTLALAEGLREIGEGAFAYCRGLTELVLPATVTHIGISAFSMCEGLEEVRMTVATEGLCDAMTYYGCRLMQERKNRKIASVGGVEYAVWKR